MSDGIQNIIIISPDTEYIPFFLTFFLKYQEKNITNVTLNRKEGWYSEEMLSTESILKEYNFKFKNYKITYKILDEYENYRTNTFPKLVYELKKKFDRVIYIDFRWFYSNFLDYEISFFKQNNLVEYIFFSVEEATSNDFDVNLIESVNIKVITCDVTNGLTSPNLFSHPFLSFYHFFYVHGFNYLNFYDFKNEKQNLIGTYFKQNYKTERDEIIKKIKNQLKNDDESIFKIYDKEFYKNSVIKEITNYYNINKNFWEKNHISSYTDYINSVLILIFETRIEYNLNKVFLTEKTLKSLLFSKLNIPFIMASSINNLIFLKKMGYWFLNFEFIDFNKFGNDGEENLKILHNSIFESVKYALDTYKKMDGDLNKVYLYFKNKYELNMQNNYNMVIEELQHPTLNEEVLNFILNKIPKNENNPKNKKLF